LNLETITKTATIIPSKNQVLLDYDSFLKYCSSSYESKFFCFFILFKKGDFPVV